MLNNTNGVGPWEEYRALSDMMSDMWVNFVNGRDTNGEGMPIWPRYGNVAKGKNLVLQTEGQGGFYVEDNTYRLEGGSI